MTAVADGVADGLNLWCLFAEQSPESFLPDTPVDDGTVADDFGDINGTEIANKSSMLAEIDAALGVDSPPAVEYLLVLPPPLYWLPPPFSGFGLDWNNYGHSAVRYTLPTGEQKVMNIAAKDYPHSMVSERVASMMEMLTTYIYFALCRCNFAARKIIFGQPHQLTKQETSKRACTTVT
jgi:hypothetical protein